MTVSRVKKYSVLFSAFLLTAAPFSLRAEEAAPASDAPIRLGPRQPAIAPPASEAEAPPQKFEERSGGTIRIEELSTPASNATGVLDESKGGLGLEMWKGTRHALAERLLTALPSGPKSATAHDLQKRLLLSLANAPAGDGKASLTALRVDKLFAMGETESAVALLKAAKMRGADEPQSRMNFEGMLLAGDVKGACGEANAAIKQYKDPFWQKALIYCQAASGDKAKAGLGLDILRDQGHDDPAFFHLAELLLGVRGDDPKGLTNLSPLHVALLRAAKRPVSEEVLRNAKPTVLKALALSQGVAPLERLAAAEQAEASGALDTESLRKLYLAVEFTPQEISGALSNPQAGRDAKGRALLFKAASGQSVGAARAEVISKAISVVQNDGGSLPAYRLYSKMIEQMSPSPALSWFSGTAVRALLAVGRLEGAKPWMSLLYEARGLEDRRTAASLAPLARIADPQNREAWGLKLDEQWKKAQEGTPNVLLSARLTLVLSMLEALGENVGDSWMPLLSGPQADSPSSVAGNRASLWNGLRRAVEGARKGEAAAFALLVLGEKSFAELDAVTLQYVVFALYKGGFEPEARHLALEALISAGL
jgi:hypothetical protein